MKIKFMGTAAYEGVPSLFCTCRVCKKSKELGGRNIRTRSQTLINDEVLIEFNADTVSHFLKYGFDWEKIGACLITHSHCDHLYPEDLEMARDAYTHKHRALKMYAAASGYKMIGEVIARADDNSGLEVNLIKIGERFEICDGKYSVMPMRANHDERSSPVIFSITCGNKRMLYAHDTGVFFEDTRTLLIKEECFDLVSLDCTGCLGLGGGWRDGHMSFNTNLEMICWMRENGLVNDKTVIVVNHFSHNGGQVYDEMLEEAEKHGIIVSYDGLEIEF